MSRKKQYENQVTDLALGHAPVILLNPIIILQYFIIIANMVQQTYSYQMLYSNGRGGLSTLAEKSAKRFKSYRLLWSLCKRWGVCWSKTLR